jgi:hypothetical protein
MGKVFLTRSREPEPEEVEGVPPLADVPWVGEYSFLYPGFVDLRERTGEFIDPQKDAFFQGANMDALEAFIHEWSAKAKAQPESWEQRVGIAYPSREVICRTTSRDSVLAFLTDVLKAIEAARVSEQGVFFWGE